MNTEQLLKGLNPEQRAAVEAGTGENLLVLAGAGCGKTTVLVRRIAYLATHHCAPDQIIALTFSRKAAEEMGARLPALLGPGVGAGAVSTFHAFALSAVCQRIRGTLNAQHLGFRGLPSVLPSGDRLEILARISSSEERRALGVDLIRLDDMLTRRDVRGNGDSSFSPGKLKLLESIRSRFAEEKRVRSAWDFCDMIQGALRLFGEHPEIAHYYAGRFRAVLVDEFQDTNPLQIELLRHLLSGGAHLYAVGDDDQAIYGFRGADTRPILEFEQHFSPATILKLQTNYRSTRAVLATANRIFRHKPRKYRKVLRCARAGADRGPRPKLITFRTRRDLVEWVRRTMVRIGGSEAIPSERMTMLFRINESLNQTRALLVEEPGSGPVPQLLTIHGSKGLEFPVVFLCDLEEGVFPNHRTAKRARARSLLQLVRRLVHPPKLDCDLEEEKRLFYVGVTRAARWLFILTLKEREMYGRRKQFQQSRFLRIVR